MDIQKLQQTAQAMVASGKGILAIDESHSTCKKRFEALGVVSSEENRRHYRGLLVTAPNIENYVSGMILFDETLRQATDEGKSYSQVLTDKGIMPGIKVDTGAKPLALHDGEFVTEGLDNLRDRLEEYKSLGARFAKWRAVITIGDNMPSNACVVVNAHALARYAALCQEADIVPMVEPEILIDGDHTLERCYEVTTQVYQELFTQLREQGVLLEGTILKTSMVISGTKNSHQCSPTEVAEWTVKCLKENVPSELAGVVFLSGGMTNIQSTENLNEMNKIGGTPWPLSFSYGRAIQQPALELWAEDMQGNYEEAQHQLVHRAKMNAMASLGQYTTDMENE